MIPRHIDEILSLRKDVFTFLELLVQFKYIHDFRFWERSHEPPGTGHTLEIFIYPLSKRMEKNKPIFFKGDPITVIQKEFISTEPRFHFLELVNYDEYILDYQAAIAWIFTFLKNEGLDTSLLPNIGKG